MDRFLQVHPRVFGLVEVGLSDSCSILGLSVIVKSSEFFEVLIITNGSDVIIELLYIDKFLYYVILADVRVGFSEIGNFLFKL